MKRKVAMLIVVLTITTTLASLAHADSEFGGGYIITRVEAYDFDLYYPIVFTGGERAMVEVIGDEDTDLDLYVYDSNGDLVAFDESESDHCIVSWTPERTEHYTIVIVNLGDVYNEYLLQTN
jgi:hypothetical protein